MNLTVITIVFILIFLLILTIFFLKKPKQVYIQHEPTVLEVKKIIKLSSLEIVISSMVEGKNTGYIFDKNVLYFIEGKVNISTDFENSKIDINKDKKTIFMKLLTPEITSTDVIKFDNIKRNSYTLKFIPSGFINVDPQDQASKDALFRGKQIIRKKASENGYIELAKYKTNEILSEFFRTMDWNVGIEWIIK